MGSSSNSAQREAQAEERRRQAAIAGTTNDINRLFDSPAREAERQRFGADALALYRKDADRQKGMADRDLLFAMARSGLTGGSASVDANRVLGEEYSRGVLEAERRAQGDVAALRGADEQTRLNLTSLAQSGLNTGAAATQAAAAMRASLEGAKASTQVGALGDIFGSIGAVRKRSEDMEAQRRADNLYASAYGPFWGAKK